MNDTENFPLDDGSFIASNENAETEVFFQDGIIKVKVNFVNQNGDVVSLFNNIALDWVIDEAVKNGLSSKIKERIAGSLNGTFEHDTLFPS